MENITAILLVILFITVYYNHKNNVKKIDSSSVQEIYTPVTEIPVYDEITPADLRFKLYYEAAPPQGLTTPNRF